MNDGASPQRRRRVRAGARLLGAVLACAVLAACTGRSAQTVVVSASPGAGHLLTELSAEVGREGVALSWKVDEARAGRITGFACVYRTPAHIELGVAGSVACGSRLSGPADRGRVVTGLPEYGDYLFEVTAQISGEPVIEWSLRALQVQLEVPRDLAGPPGPDAAVTGAGPLVTGCGPGGGRGETPAGQPWSQGDIVSAEHLTHYPGRAWAPGGDSDAAAQWPDPPSLSALFDQAGLDGQVIGRALDSAGTGTGADAGADADGTGGDADATRDALALLADDSAAVPLGMASAGTKALLRPADGGGWDLKLHTSYPFGGFYEFEPDHAVPGWGDTAHQAAWAGLWNRTDCPPPDRPDATHDVALAVSHDTGGARLQHSGYGWWAVAPVGMFPARVVATKGGLAFGDPAADLPAPAEMPAAWSGRVSGHLFWNGQRYALAGDITVTLPSGAAPQLSGRIDGVVIVPLDHATLEPRPEPPAPWHTLTLAPQDAASQDASSQDAASQDAASQDASSPAASSPDAASPAAAGWSGTITVAPQPSGDMPLQAPPPDAFAGDWHAAAHGPGAAEITGRLRLWTPLAPDGDPNTDWPAQAVIVAGFGATRTP